jgi:hypothetical protein
MKKVLLSAVFVFLGVAYAYAGEQATCPDGYTSTLNKWGHSHCYIDTDTDTDTVYKRETEVGVGADLVVWWNDTNKVKFLEEVTTQYRYDFNNGGEHKVYGVVRINPWRLFKKYEEVDTDVASVIE